MYQIFHYVIALGLGFVLFKSILFYHSIISHNYINFRVRHLISISVILSHFSNLLKWDL